MNISVVYVYIYISVVYVYVYVRMYVHYKCPVYYANVTFMTRCFVCVSYAEQLKGVGGHEFRVLIAQG